MLMAHEVDYYSACSVQFDVVGMAKLGVDSDASCIITHAYQPCLLHLTASGNHLDHLR